MTTQYDTAPRVTHSEVKTLETPIEYLRRTFSLAKNEIKVDIRPVGENSFRLNFWAEIKSDCFVPSYKINRSYYVVLERDGISWKHEVFKD